MMDFYIYFTLFIDSISNTYNLHNADSTDGLRDSECGEIMISGTTFSIGNDRELKNK
jgi:hypothetical protein